MDVVQDLLDDVRLSDGRNDPPMGLAGDGRLHPLTRPAMVMTDCESLPWPNQTTTNNSNPLI